MALDIYFRENIARVLESVDVASGGTVALINEEMEKAARKKRQLDNEELADHLRIYRQGYKDALAAVAVAFGILPVPLMDPRVDGLEPQSVLYEKGIHDDCMPGASDLRCRAPAWEKK